jgi:hypothetical protein
MPHYVPLDRQRRESYRRGSSFAWGVASDYFIRDRVVQPAPRAQQDARIFMPLVEAEEIRDKLLIVARAPDDRIEDAVLGFARRFGLLGHFALVDVDNRRGGDPLDWFRAHAEGVRTVIELLDWIDRGGRDEKELRVLLHRTVAVGQDVGYPGATWSRDGAIGRARNVIWKLINGNIEGVCRAVQPVQPSTARALGLSVLRRLDVDFKFRALAEVVWWSLTDLVVSGVTRRCEACGSVFVRRHGAQRFCPAGGEGEESACAVRYRQQQWRARRASRPSKK